MPVCPFCGEKYAPTSIALPDERMTVVNSKDAVGEHCLDIEIDQAVEPYECWCGAWYVDGMPDVEGMPDDSN